jgi:hypothetical protein
MTELFRMLSAALPGNRFRPCEAVLPVDRWCDVPQRLRFGLPWPWEPADGDVGLVDGTGAPAASDGVAIVSVLVGGDLVWRLISDWSGSLLHGELRVPNDSAEGYSPHIETMLATWSWG